MTKQVITESELQAKVASLRNYMDIVEAENNANVAGNVIGQGARTAVNAITAPARAVWDGVKWVAGNAADVAKGAYQGFTQGGLDPLLGKTNSSSTKVDGRRRSN